MSDFDHKVNRVAELEAGNQRSYEELRAETGNRFSMDTADLRRELFFKKMIEWGLITREQFLEYEIAFHEEVEEALNGAWERFRESKKKNRLTVVQKPNQQVLLGTDGRPLPQRSV